MTILFDEFPHVSKQIHFYYLTVSPDLKPKIIKWMRI